MKVHPSLTRSGLVSVGVLVGCVACSSPVATGPVDGDGTAGEVARGVAVDVFIVGPEAQRSGATVPGLISADGVAIVLAKRDGTLVQITIEEGARVAEGQTIARLDDGDAPFQLEQARLELRRAQVEQQQANALVRANQVEYHRQLALFKEGLVSRRDVDQSRTTSKAPAETPRRPASPFVWRKSGLGPKINGPTSARHSPAL